MKRLLVFGFTTLLIFLLTVVQVQTQRGGGGGARSRSRSHSSPLSSLLSKKSSSKDSKKSSSWPFWAIGGAFSITKKLSDERKKKIEKLMQDYKAKLQQFPSALSEEQRSSIINSLVKNKHTMSINANNGQKFTCETKIVEIKKQTNSKYKVTFSGKDQVGNSTLNGLIIFSGQGFGLKLSKEYQDKQKAKQTGRFDILLYQGVSQNNAIQGQWAFNGFETSQKYAGKWKMIKR